MELKQIIFVGHNGGISIKTQINLSQNHFMKIKWDKKMKKLPGPKKN